MFALENGSAAIQTNEAKPNNLTALIPLLREIANLKRVRAANFDDSFAARLFYRAWGGLVGGTDTRRVAVKITAEAIAAAQLGAIDREILRNAGLSKTEIKIVFERAFDFYAAVLAPDLRFELSNALNDESDFAVAEIPLFVEKLARQPRSGATKPNAPKLVFDNPENHAEHCVSTAVFAVLLAPHFNADVSTVFLTGLAHHFHNADLPDSGFAGEELLGEFLPQIFDNLREQCLSELPPNLAASIRPLFKIIETAETSAAQTFHAADVYDRVLQMRHHAEANEFTLDYAMNDLELVHAGAVQKFHYDVLRQANLI